MRRTQPCPCPALVLGPYKPLKACHLYTIAPPLKEACQAPFTACRRAVAVDVESTTRSSAPPAETSGKEHRLQPALAARRFAQKLAALTTLYALNKALAVAVADAGIHAPSALIGELLSSVHSMHRTLQVACLQVSKGPHVACENHCASGRLLAVGIK